MKISWPIKNIGHTPGIYITQYFGENPQNYPTYKGHMGTDIGAPKSTPIYASHSGTAQYTVDNGGYGKNCKIFAPQGFMTIYGHMDAFEGANRTVSEGDLIGYVGTTGNSTGYHCHLGFLPINPDYNNGYGGYIDPMPLMKIRISRWIGYKKSPQKDFYLPMPDLDTYAKLLTGELQIKDVYQVGDYEIPSGLDKPLNL